MKLVRHQILAAKTTQYIDMYTSPWATIIKWHKFSDLNNRELLSHSFGGWKRESQGASIFQFWQELSPGYADYGL